jgi:rhamnosyl/mannosyltransferase
MILKGGIQRYVKDLSELQATKGYNVTIYSCSKTPNKTVVNNVTIKRFNYFEIFRTPIAIGMIISLLRDKFDIIHIHAQFPLVAELISLIAKLKGIPIIITYHNEVNLINESLFARIAYNIWSNTLLKLMLSLSNIIIATTKEFALTSNILNNHKFNKKIKVIPCGILYKTSDITLTNNNYYLLYVGRIKPEKGIHVLIEALYILKKEKNLELDLVIIGEYTRKDELEYKNELEQLSIKLDLLKNIKFTGSVSDDELEAYYNGALALVLPSLNRLEGFGIVQLEALKHGIPIIVSDIEGVRNVAKNISITVKPNNPHDLANSILKIMDPYIRENIKRLSLEKVKEYDWNNLIEKINELYMDVINKKSLK